MELIYEFSHGTLQVSRYFVISLVECYIGHWHLNTYIKALGILTTLFLLHKTHVKNKKIVALVRTFMVYMGLTTIMYLFNGRPISLVRDDLMNMFPAMLFVWVGMADNRSENTFYKKFLIYGGIIFAIGLSCYLGNMGWYMARMAEARNQLAYIDSDSYNADNIWGSLRFCSFFSDSYQVSHFSAFGVGAALFFVNSTSRFKYDYIYLSIFALACLLCQHRVAIAVCIAAFVFFFFYKRLFFNIHFWAVIAIMATFIVSAVSCLGVTLDDNMELLIEKVLGRLKEMTFSQAMEGSRTEQAARLLRDFHSLFVGEGLGSASPVAAYFGFSCIADGAYVKLLFETGIIGLSFFIYIAIITIVRGLKKFSYLFIDLFVICFTLVAMTGSNTLTMGYLLTIPFWYALGHIWNDDYLNNAIQSNIKLVR